MAADDNPDDTYMKLSSPQAYKLKEENVPVQETPDIAKGSSSLFDLYRFATFTDLIWLLMGVVGSTVNGALFPVMAVVFGNTFQAFSSVPIDQEMVNTASLHFLLIAIALFISEYMSYIGFHYSAERQMQAMRAHALRHMLYMDISWFDSHEALQLSNRLTGDTVKIKQGMGFKLGHSCRFTCQFVSGIIVGFIRGWDVALVMAAAMPIVTLSLAYFVKKTKSMSDWSQTLYAEAGAIAEETIGNIRTVASLNSEQHAIDKYEAKTVEVERGNIKLAKIVGALMGIFIGSLWLMYSIGLWYGGFKVSDNRSEPGAALSAFFGTLLGLAAMANISPNVSAVSQAMGAAKELFDILDTPSSIDASKDEGEVPAKCDGAIEAKNLYFTYPSRPDAPILRDYNVRIEAGQTVAFAGQSGGGKSTLISLLERFYDPTAGQLLLDGRDIKTLNISWLRSQIGLVSQEPVLFATTILENIRAGGQDISREQAVEAAKLANAHKFISALPNGYDTMVGERGVSLSGGQKQRVAIARAVVREPKILVLDEATSALDAESERVVQAALNDLMSKTQMTTLVIAHRLTTIRNADKIVVLSEGHVAETGTHDELNQLEHGIYRSMFRIQQTHATKEEVALVDATVDDIDAADQVYRSSIVSDKTNISTSDVEDNSYDRVPFGLKEFVELSMPEKRRFVYGCIASAIVGAAKPGSALLVGGMITTMTQQYADYQRTDDKTYLDDIYSDVQLYGIIYLVIMVIMFFSVWLQQYSFKYMQECLAKRLRDTQFRAVVHQNVGFFDETDNGTGALAASISTDAAKVAVLSGDSQARIVEAFFTIVACLIVSFIFGSWILTLVMMGIFPLLILGNYFRIKFENDMGTYNDDLADASAIASERLSNIRTVVALGVENQSTEEYKTRLEVPFAKGIRGAHINGIAVGFCAFILLATYSFIFYLGGVLVDDGRIEFEALIRTFMAVLLSIDGVAGATSYVGDFNTALHAGSTIMSVVHRKVPIDSFEESGEKPSKVDGQIEFQDISFRYPSRSDITVLKRFSLTIEPGQTVAFCGPSGGGKSTCVSLIERFYDPVRGQVLLDGKNIKELNLQWLRSQIGLVGQEPTLFIGTIAENIAMGLGREPSQAEIEEAAKMANAHDFISQFPDGYETQVGLKGEQLSGGQKQRIAIARAILKDPDILLLDEATSALDSESEKIVQEALDKVVALKRRTTIIIAHRLSTIRKADKICVVSKGVLEEQGTHTELMSLNGVYRQLVETSMS